MGVTGAIPLLNALGFTRSPSDDGKLVLEAHAMDIGLLNDTASKIFFAIPQKDGGGGPDNMEA